MRGCLAGPWPAALLQHLSVLPPGLWTFQAAHPATPTFRWEEPHGCSSQLGAQVRGQVVRMLMLLQAFQNSFSWAEPALPTFIPLALTASQSLGMRGSL